MRCSMPKPARTSCSQQVCESLWNRLLYGDLAPGQTIVVDQIAREIGVSHIPVREAVLQLCGEGVLARNGREIVVSQLDRREIVELLDMRATLENHAAGLAANRICDVTVDDIERLIEIMHGVVDEIAAATDAPVLNALGRWGIADMLFHRLVIRASGNREVLKTVERGVIRMFGFRMDYLEGATNLAQRLVGDYAVHLQVLESLKRHDPQAARKAMAAHSQRARRNLLARLDEMQRNSTPMRSVAAIPEYPEWLQATVRDIESHDVLEAARTGRLPLDESICRVWRHVTPPPTLDKITL